MPIKWALLAWLASHDSGLGSVWEARRRDCAPLPRLGQAPGSLPPLDPAGTASRRAPAPLPAGPGPGAGSGAFQGVVKDSQVAAVLFCLDSAPWATGGADDLLP